MIEDAELLRRFAKSRADAVFAELVRRYLNLVHSAAVRQVGGDHHLAEEVTQSVFIDLARKADSLLERPVLSGWLYTSAYYAAAKAVRGEQRRRVREQEAQLMRQSNASLGTELQWEQLRPVLDAVMHELPERDREAILQRYFEGKPFQQIGAKFGLTENAARMRVERALEKLRTRLATRGVASTNSALATVLGAQTVLVAPAALLATVVGASLAAAATTGGTAAVGSGMATANLKVAISLACVLGAVVALFLQHQKLNQLGVENAALHSMRPTSGGSPPELSPLSPSDLEELGRLRREHLELLRLRGEVGRLRREIADARAKTSSAVRKEASENSTEEQPAAQINIKARFVSGSTADLAVLGVSGEGETSLLDANQMKVLARKIEESQSLQLLSEMSVTTLSGRAAQISSAEPVTNSNGIKAVGPVLDVLPLVGADGRTIQLTLIGRLEDTYRVKDDGTLRLPFMADTNQATSAVVWDGQTIAVFKKSGDQHFVMLVTPTLIDSAGNQIHDSTGEPTSAPKLLQP